MSASVRAVCRDDLCECHQQALIPFDDRPGVEFRVDADDLHRFLELSRDISTWMKDRIEKFQLVEGKDFEVFAKFGENPQGGRPRSKYMLTVTAAR